LVSLSKRKGSGMTGITDLFQTLLAQYGVAALFLSVMFESLGAPLPGESAIVLTSAAAARGEFNITAIAVAAFLGAVIGDNIGYLIGRRFGRAVLVRYGSRFGVTDRNLDRAEAVARRRGPLMVVFARFVVILRQLNGIVAGTTGMRWPTFLVANTIGAALWVGLWTTLAYRFGHSTAIVPFIWHHLSLVAAVAIPLLVLLLVWLHTRPKTEPR
jgi:membrane protein DedA with SNARE-associated domain